MLFRVRGFLPFSNGLLDGCSMDSWTMCSSKFDPRVALSSPMLTVVSPYPDHRKDLKNRSLNLGPYTTKGYFQGALLGVLFFRSSRWSGYAQISDSVRLQNPLQNEIMQTERFQSLPKP